MSSFDIGTINMTLDRDSIDEAIDKSIRLIAYVEKVCNELVLSLTKRGLNIAQIYALKIPHDANVAISGSLKALFYPQERCGVIYTDEPIAVYAEYGTGFLGAFDPHQGLLAGESIPPVMTYTTKSGELHTYTKYDTYEHGEAGWVYEDEYGERVWTNGQPAMAFMYETLQTLREIAPKDMREKMEGAVDKL